MLKINKGYCRSSTHVRTVICTRNLAVAVARGAPVVLSEEIISNEQRELEGYVMPEAGSKSFTAHWAQLLM